MCAMDEEKKMKNRKNLRELQETRPTKKKKKKMMMMMMMMMMKKKRMEMPSLTKWVRLSNVPSQTEEITKKSGDSKNEDEEERR